MYKTPLTTLLLLSACSGAPAGPATTTADLTSTSDPAPRWTTALPDPTTTTTTTPSTTTTTCPDLPSEGYHCDPRTQDCPAGFKCTPFGSAMMSDWDGARCVPLPQDPAALGDPCETQHYTHSGIDDCDIGLLCWYFQSIDDLRGRCLGICRADDTCLDPEARCYQPQAPGYLCYPLCDPLAQDCPPPAELCVRSPSVDGFICRYAPAGEPAEAGMPCATETDCAPGHLCDPADLIDNCPGERCCAPLCSLSQPACPPALPQCQPYAPDPPAAYPDLGVCRAL